MNTDESAGTSPAWAGYGPSSHNQREGRQGQLRPRIRELVGNLMRDVLAALATASPTEIAELLARAPGPVSWKRAAKARASSPSPRMPHAPAYSVPEASGSIGDSDKKPPPAPADPFDITSPGELLASPDEILPPAPETPRVDPPMQEPVQVPPPIEAPAAERRDEQESSTALRDVDADAASERRPKFVLRAGERLLSATGSGVVIRRERRTTPKD